MGNVEKVVEVIAQSDKGFEDAVRSTVQEAAKTNRKISFVVTGRE